MSIEVLERAIAKLEQLKAEATLLPWEVETIPETGESRILGPSSLLNFYEVAPGQMRKADADLIVALSRCVDPTLDSLLFARGLFGARIQGEQAAATVDLAVYLARSILGESS